MPRSKAWFVLFAIAVIWSALGGSPLTAGTMADWATIQFTADQQRGDVLYRIYGTFAGDGRGPLVIGSGDGGEGFRGIDIDLACCGGSASLTTSALLGGLEINFFDQERATGSFTRWLEVSGYALEIGETKAALVFFVNASIATLEVERVSGSAIGTISTTTGSGSKVFYDADPGAGGASIGLGKLAAGVSTYSYEATTGIVGSLYVLGCEECLFQWQSPDGRGASYVQVSDPTTIYGLSCCPDFTGPSGDWYWIWGGIDIPSTFDLLMFDPFSRAVVGAFAPIGSSWSLFDSSSGW